MKKILLFMIFLISAGISTAQETTTSVKEGETLVLGKNAGIDYQHVDFPRKNIIIKRGAIPNFKNLVGEKLIVERFKTDKRGNVRVVLRRKNGQNFFRFYPKVTANLEKALSSGEICKSP